MLHHIGLNLPISKCSLIKYNNRNPPTWATYNPVAYSVSHNKKWSSTVGRGLLSQSLWLHIWQWISNSDCIHCGKNPLSGNSSHFSILLFSIMSVKFHGEQFESKMMQSGNDSRLGFCCFTRFGCVTFWAWSCNALSWMRVGHFFFCLLPLSTWGLVFGTACV